jgi:hypothetical protein
MTLKALILEFILVAALAVVLIFLLTIGAVQLIDRVVGPADQPANTTSPTAAFGISELYAPISRPYRDPHAFFSASRH